jgi:hypothetical protein
MDEVRMGEPAGIPDGEYGVPQFPGPRIFFPSPAKWLKLTLGSGLLTAIGIAMMLDAASFGVFVTASFGVGTLLGLTMLLPGANSLRLDGEGFEITKFFFRRQRYNWLDVSDFAVWEMSRNRFVVFKAEKPRLGIYERISAAMTDGRNGYLPDTYGMVANDLAELMTNWRNSAIKATKQPWP